MLTKKTLTNYSRTFMHFRTGITKLFIVLVLLFSLSACKNIPQDDVTDFSGYWDFSDGKIPDAWIPKAATWKVVNGELVNDDKISHAGMIVSDIGAVSDFDIEADIKINKEYLNAKTTWAGFHLRSDMPLYEPLWANGYLVILYPHGAVTALCMNAEMKLGSLFPPSPKGEFNKLRVKMTGPLMEIFVNDKKVLEHRDEKYATGGISLVNYGNEAVFDNVRLKAEPVTSLSSNKKIRNTEPKVKSQIKPLRKITVKRGNGKSGYFVYKETGEKFVPDGYNHTIGDADNYKIPHATFNVGTYNSKRIDKVLAEMKGLGANTVRVWLWGTDHNGKGIWGGTDSETLNREYMENFCDFLRLASKHGIYVIPILDLAPLNAKYKSIIKEGLKSSDKKITDHNADILTQGFINARKQAIRDTINFIKEADPNLLNTILGWSLGNEVFVVSENCPFNLTNGFVKVANGKTYDMSDFNSRQKCADESFLYWANQLADVIHKEDPSGLVTIGMWTSDAHGRPPVNGIIDKKGIDSRFPPRPSVFASRDSLIDFLDIHVYPWQNKFLINSEAHESDEINKSGLPVIVGEYGVFTYQAKNALEGAAKIIELRKKCYDAGYAGALLWVWNYTNGLYNGEMEEVKEALSKAR